MVRMSVVLSIMLVVCAGSSAQAELNVAEQLLVNLDVESLEYGPVAGTWLNSGTLGDFTPNGSPVVEDIAGVKAVTFNGANWFDGPTSTSGIEGAGTRSIEVWAYNPSIVAEETMVSWSHRGGPEGTNVSFNYGNDTRWGAFGHWGGDTHDMGWWGTHAPAPTVGNWWHLVYVYNGTGARIYVNGVEESVRDPLSINTHSGNIIRVGAQANDAGTGATLWFTGSIAQVRIHDGALTADQVMNNYQWTQPRNAWKPAPADGEVIQQIARLLSWEAGTFAAQHQVYFSDSEAAVSAGSVTPVTTTTNSHIVTGLTPGTTYYWRVDEVNDTHPDSPWPGSVWSFTVAATKAYQPSPADGTENQVTNPTLTWSTGLAVAIQEFFVGTDYDTVFNAAPGSGTIIGMEGTRSLSGLVRGTTYYWRVDTYNQSYQLSKGDVWSFSTIPVIPVTDPNLVGWWKFDEGDGGMAVDWSGHDRHATILGGTTWVDGYYDGALSLEGTDGYVSLPIGSVIPTLNAITVAGWVDFDNAGGAWQRIFDIGSGSDTVYMFLCPRTGTGGPMRLAITTSSGAGESLVENNSTLPSGWHHVAGTIDSTGLSMYLDGVLVASGATAVIPSDLGTTINNWLGRSQYAADGYLSGDLDDFRIYDYAMTAADIPQAMRGDPLLAWDPQPANHSSVLIDEGRTLSWSAGDSASQHDVYFGTDAAAVGSATTGDTTGLYKGRQVGTTYAAPVAMGGTYYWRIDEVNTDSSISKGRVWNFSVLDYLLVDDFESYGAVAQLGVEGQRIWYVWLDGYGYTTPPPGYGGNGSGSMVDLGAVSVSGQSLQMDFTNTTVPYSQVEAATSSLPIGSNWNREGVKALALSFRGYPPSIGGVTQNGTQYTVKGAGADIWDVLYTGEVADDGYHDEFHYMYVAMTPGTHTITARVESIVNTNGWAKAGVMIRDSLDPKSQHVIAAVSPSNGTVQQWRPSLGAASTGAANRDAGALDPDGAAPIWVRLSRQTDGTIEGRYSKDGTTWTLLHSDGAPTIAINAPTMYLGLAVCSHNAGTATTAVFSNVTVNGSPITGWSNQDVGILSNNGTDPLYVELKSGATTKRIEHPDPTAVQSGTFQQVNIALSDFSPVSMNNVTSIVLGTGTPGGALGNSGTIYVDDIRLYPPRYLPGMLTPWAEDLVQDGTVDLQDAEAMFADWLQDDYYVEAVNPGTGNLVAYYPLDSGFNDASGNGHHGDPCGTDSAIITDAVRGNVATFDGINDYVDTGTWNPSAATGQITVAVWAKWAGLSDYYQGLVGKRDTWANADMMWQLEGNVDTGMLGWLREGSYPDDGDPVLPVGKWTHVAVTFDGTTATMYINGRPTGSGPFSFGSDTTAHLVFGACEANGGNPFNGELDEIRIYNRGLSAAEVAYLSCEAAGQCYIPVIAPGNISDTEAMGDRVVNFKDLAVLLDKFMTTQVWPE